MTRQEWLDGCLSRRVEARTTCRYCQCELPLGPPARSRRYCSMECHRAFQGKRWAQLVPGRRSPTTFDLYWAAGFLDGEGCFTVYTDCYPRLSAGQTERWPLERLQEIFGGNIRPVKAEQNKLARKDYWVWTLSGMGGRGVMMTLYCLLSPRRQDRIREVLSKWQGIDKSLSGLRGRR